MSQLFLAKDKQIDKMPVEYTKTESNTGIVTIDFKVNVLEKIEKDYICFPYVNGKCVNMEPERGSYFFESEVPIDSIFFLIAKKPFVLRGTGTYGCYNDIYTEAIHPHLSAGGKINITMQISAIPTQRFR
ncbi:hypothetical protein FACS1894203_5610 [Bacteroidia bacterium]|nr:hypothetical protein FACS1894203_5610 [Bacteroidia bacterium]